MPKGIPWKTEQERIEGRKATKKRWADKNKKRLVTKTRDYRYTLRGKLLWTYLNMKKRVEGRDTGKAHLYLGHSICPKDEFIEWGLNSPEYIRLYTEWAASGYIPKLRPSVDRIDPRHGYEFWNMQWLTLSQNSTKAGLQRWHGVSAA